MNQRETRKFLTHNGNEVVVYTYMTVHERRKIRSLFMDNNQAIDAKGAFSPTLNSESISKSEDLTIEIMVQSYNGSSENILERLYDNADEFESVLKGINETQGLHIQK